MDLKVPALPAQFAAAGVLIFSPERHLLLVRTHDRDELVLPGGIVEAGEPPAAATEREVEEELGVQLQVSRLLVVQHKPAADGRPASLMFTFDTALVLERDHSFRLQAEEIAETIWLPPAEAIRRHTSAGRARLRMAMSAREEGTTVYMDADRTIS